MTEKTWTANEIEGLVLSYREGCSEGKVEFLRSAFGIEATCEQEFTITIRVEVSKWDNDGDEIDAHRVMAEVVDICDSYLSGQLDASRAEAFGRTAS